MSCPTIETIQPRKPASDPEQIEELEDELENAGMALFLKERLAEGEGKRLSAGEFLEKIG